MAITQLSLYNGALRKIKERKLATLTDNTEPRRLLDDVWDGLITECLEMALWRFARRTVKIEYDTDYTAAFGHTYRFVKPDDFVRTIGVWHDDRLNTPLLDYLDEGGYWYSDSPDLYVSYVSNATEYGSNFSLWPESFKEMFEYQLASGIVGRLSQSTTSQEQVKSMLEEATLTAKANSAMEGPSKMLPTSRWVAARLGRSRRGDLGNKGSLIG